MPTINRNPKKTLDDLPKGYFIEVTNDMPFDMGFAMANRDRDSDCVEIRIRDARNHHLGRLVISANFNGTLSTHSRADEGWGPILYELAMEVAALNGQFVRSGINGISKQAMNVWRKFRQRAIEGTEISTIPSVMYTPTSHYDATNRNNNISLIDATDKPELSRPLDASTKPFYGGPFSELMNCHALKYAYNKKPDLIYDSRVFVDKKNLKRPKTANQQQPTLIKNEYMPDEVSDNLVQTAKMLKHHVRYLKHVVSTELNRNPPSKGFKRLGGGYCAVAHTDNKEVELIVGPVRITDEGFVEYDLSREIMISVREEAPPRLKKYFPDIRGSRIELSSSYDACTVLGNNVRLPEIIYTMPLYRRVDSANSVKIFSNMRDILGHNPDPPTNKSDSEFQEAFYLVKDAATRYGATLDVGKIHDVKIENFSQSEDGTIIIRDPFVLAADGFFGKIRIAGTWSKEYSDVFSQMQRLSAGSTPELRPRRHISIEEISGHWIDPGHSSRILSNPPSNGFYYFDRGSYATIYHDGYGNLEIIIDASHSWKVDETTRDIDVSKEILMLASAMDSSGHLPEISRISISKKPLELKYKSKMYSQYTGRKIKYIGKMTISELVESGSVELILGSWATRPVKALFDAAKALGLEHTATNDIATRNITVDETGKIILVDPLACLVTKEMAIKVAKKVDNELKRIKSR